MKNPFNAIATLGCLIVLLPHSAHAASTTWDFDVPGEYTVSDAVQAEVASSDARLTELFEFQVNDEIESVQRNLQIIQLVDDNILVTWHSFDANHAGTDNSSYHIAAKVIDASGVVVIPEFQVNDEIEGGQQYPQVTQLVDSNILFVWHSSDTNHAGTDSDSFHIAAKVIQPDGTVVIPEFQVNDEIEGTQEYPQVTQLVDDNILFTWESYDTNHAGTDNSSAHIAAKVIQPDGTVVTPEFQVNDEISGTQKTSQVIQLSDSNILFVWSSYDANHAGTDNSFYHIAAKVIQPDGTVVTPEFQVNDEIESNQSDPQVTQLLDGNILFTWYSYDANHAGTDNDNTHIAAKVIQSDGTVVIPEFQVNDEIESTQLAQQVIQLTSGNILFTWHSADTNHAGTDNDSYHIAAKVIQPDGTVVTPEFQVNDEIESAQQYPQVTQLANDNILFTWSSADTNHSGTDNNSHIAAKIIQPDGTPLYGYYPSSTPSVEASESVTYNGPLTGFSETLSASTTGSVQYQLSPDAGTTWYYHDGADWVTTVAGVSESNTAADIDADIDSFHTDAGTGFLIFKTFLISDGTQQVELDAVTIEGAFYTFEVTLLDPTTDSDVINEGWFPVTVEVTCTSGDCGDLDLTLDPIGTFFFERTDFGSEQDCITSNVCLTRGDFSDLYNAVTEAWSSFDSPHDTEWYNGACGADPTVHTYQDWIFAVGFSPSSAVGNSMCIHLITDDIYIDLEFQSWTGGGGGGFSYYRTELSPAKGTIPTTPTQPFYTSELTNPVTITLGEGETHTETFWVYADGTVGDSFDFFVYAQPSNGDPVTAESEKYEITIIDPVANSDPTDITLEKLQLDEGLPIGTSIDELTTTDSDNGDTHTYSFSCVTPGADDEFFTISGTELQSAVVFDFENPQDADTDNIYEVCVVSYDSQGGIYEKIFLITVRDIATESEESEQAQQESEQCSGTIGNTIWLDSSADGIQQDNEPGIENIRVKLISAGDDNSFDSDDDEHRTDTNHNGHYLFEDLDEGRYRVVVKEQDIAHLIQTYDPTGSIINNKASLELECDDDHTKADFGFTDTETTLAVTGWSVFGLFSF